MESDSKYWLNDDTFCFSLLMTQYLCLGEAQNVHKWLQLMNYIEPLYNILRRRFKNIYPNLIGMSDVVRN